MDVGQQGVGCLPAMGGEPFKRSWLWLSYGKRNNSQDVCCAMFVSQRDALAFLVDFNNPHFNKLSCAILGGFRSLEMEFPSALICATVHIVCF